MREFGFLTKIYHSSLRLSIRRRMDRRRRIFLEGFPQDSVRFHDSSDSRQFSRITLFPANSPVLERPSCFGWLFIQLFKRFFCFFCRTATRALETRVTQSFWRSAPAGALWRFSLRFVATTQHDGSYFCATTLSHCFSSSLCRHRRRSRSRKAF